VAGANPSFSALAYHSSATALNVLAAATRAAILSSLFCSDGLRPRASNLRAARESARSTSGKTLNGQDPEGERLVSSEGTVVHPPIAPSRRKNEEMQAAGIGELVSRVAAFRRLDRERRESHEGFTPSPTDDIPPNTPSISPDHVGCCRIGRDIHTTKYHQKTWVLWTSADSGGRRFGAGEGNRTLVFSLGSCCSTIELHPRQCPV
jgi:hypothetical protein